MEWVGSKSSAWLLVLAHRLAEVLEVSTAEVPVGSGFEAHRRRLVEGIGEEVGGVDLLDRDAVGHHVCTDDNNAAPESAREKHKGRAHQQLDQRQRHKRERHQVK